MGLLCVRQDFFFFKQDSSKVVSNSSPYGKIKFKISARRDKEYPSYDHVKLHFFLHISVKMVNLEDIQLLSSLQYYFITWFGDSIVGIENSRHFNEKLC